MKPFYAKASAAMAVIFSVFMFQTCKKTPEERAADRAREAIEDRLDAERMNVGRGAADYFYAKADSMYKANKEQINSSALPAMVEHLQQKFSTASIKVTGRIEKDDYESIGFGATVTVTDTLGNYDVYKNGKKQ